LVPYDTIRRELAAHDEALVQKPEFVILTKSDMVSDAARLRAEKKFTKRGSDVLSVTILDDASLKRLRDALILRLQRFATA
jgi:GTPase involved in cell partitioning and DNA repair